MADDLLEKKYADAANAIIKAGIIPFPNNDTVHEILKNYLDEDDLDFIIKAFKGKPSLSIDEVVKKTKLSPEEVEEKADRLAKKGFIFNQPSSSGLMVYRLLPLEVVGTMEYTYMQPLPEDPEQVERLKKLAALYDNLLGQLAEKVQENFDGLTPMFEKMPPTDRTVPIYQNIGGSEVNVEINQEVAAKEVVLPAQTVEDIINKFDDIAVGNCFCRQQAALLGQPCKTNAPLEVCFTFGKSARHTIAQGFARRVSKEEAIDILKSTDEAGLVHKAFHNGSDITKEENSICNCCKDCCHTFQYWRMGALPMTNSTSYLSHVIQDGCTGCGMCVDRCPMDAITLNDDAKAEVNEQLCIGCGVCAHFCPENTIMLQQGLRTVFALPPRK
ncbi:MAG TPA: 4Fe-4S binding protein [Candidatus Lokiarchaeia archaeon]|nr:4Fe-4S binding protein [Candidatus Lokiarchaeia archaeon]